MWDFEKIEYLYGLIIVFVMIIAFVRNNNWREKTQKLFADSHLISNILDKKLSYKIKASYVLLTLSVLFLILALANFRYGTKVEKVKSRGANIIFLLDVSKSMMASDVAPSRIEKAKKIISNTIDNLAGDKVSIVIYADKSYPILPITTDYSVAKMILNSIDTDMISSQGTAIFEAIDFAKKYTKEVENTAIVILSDGENHGDYDMDYDTKNIISLGLGTVSGAPIPIDSNSFSTTYKKDKNGKTVITKLDEKTLKSLGKYMRVKSVKSAVRFVFDEISSMEKTEFESKEMSDYKNHFKWFIFVAIIFLFVEFFVSQNKKIK